MKLSEIFTLLTYGELSQLSIGGQEQGQIQVSNYSAIVGSVNLGLTDLYKRFRLKEGRVLLQMIPGRLTYPLNSRFALSNTASPETKFLLDTQAEPFTDTVHKIERVYAGQDLELSLNDENDPLSSYTPSPLVLRLPSALVNEDPGVPQELLGAPLQVVYRDSHPRLTVSAGFSPEQVELELPDTHLEALLYYVASRHHNPAGMLAEFNSGNAWAAKYEMECQRLKDLNLEVDLRNSNSRIVRNGWV